MMVVEGNGEVSACGCRGSEDIGIGDLEFRGDVTGASGSDEEIENYSDGEEVDIMVGFMGTDVVFDGIYGAEGQEDSREEEFRNFELQIEETLEIKDEEGYQLYGDKVSGVDKSDEIVSCVRALVKSLPLPGQISPEELLEINPQAFTHKHNSEEVFDVVDQVKPYLKRKHESKEECGSRHARSSMSNIYQEFEDFLISSTKYLPKTKTLSQPRLLKEVAVEDHNTKFQKGLDGKSEKEPSHPDSCDEPNLPCPVKDIKDSYWTDMVIETACPVKLPSVDTVSDSQVLNSQSTRLGAEDPNNGLRKKNVNFSHISLAARTDKYSPAELILTFDDTQAIPSESKLNNIFKRFGTLRETETVIYQESSRARVVFKKSSDAEIAVSSAKTFNILGSSVISYELGHTPLLSYNAMPALKVENAKVMVQITHSEQAADLQYDPEDVFAQQIHFEDVEEVYEPDITVETDGYEALDDVDIMT